MIFKFNNKQYFVFTTPLEFDNHIVRIGDNYFSVDCIDGKGNSTLTKLTVTDILRSRKDRLSSILQAYEVTTEEEIKLKDYKIQDCLLSDIDSIKYIQL